MADEDLETDDTETEDGGDEESFAPPAAARSAPNPGGQITAVAPSMGSGEQESYIRAGAARRNINPNVAVDVAKSEGLGRSYTGDSGSSFGPFQLHVGGIAAGGNAVTGLGDEFKKKTGLDPSDPSTVRQQIDFALDHAAANGWQAWHGWKGDPQAGIAGDVTPKLPQVFERAAEARDQGYSWDDIDSFLMNKRAESQAAGYSDAEINGYLGLPAPKDMATARGQLLQRGYKPEEVDGLIRALSTAAEPTAGDVLRPQGWSVEGATQFFGQKVVNGIHAALESQDGKPKTKEDEDRLKTEMAPAAAAFTAAPYAEGDPNLSLEDVKNMGKGAVAAIAGFPGDVSALAAWGGSLIGLKSKPMLPTTGSIEQAMGNPDNQRGKLYQTLGEVTGGMVPGPTGALKKAIEIKRAFLPTVKDALDAAVSVTKGGTEGDLNAAFHAIGQHYLETGTHPMDAAYQAQSDPSLAAKLAGRMLADETGALRLGPEAPEFPYPRDAPELTINVTSIQKENPTVSNGVVDAFRKAFSPYNRGQEAADTAAVLREGLAKVAADYNSASYTLRDFGRSVGELTPAQKMDFVHAFETGETDIFKNTPLGDLAGEIHNAFERRYAAMEKRGIVDSYIQNYITHLWRDPVAAGKFYAQRPMAGSRLFTNQRVYATYREGMANGLVPLTTNPVEIALTGLHQMDRAIAAHDMMSELSERGLVRGVPFGERLGVGEIPIDDRIARPNVAGEEGHRYVAPEAVATIVNRAFSPGLGGNAIYQKIRSAGNMLNNTQLGLSGFHLGFVTADAFTSSVAQGVKQISRLDLGEAAQGVKSIVTAPAAPFRNLIAGWKVWNQALGLKDYGPEVKSIADALIAGGGRIGMERQYAGSSAYGSFFSAMKGSLQKTVGEYGNMTVRQDLAQMFADAEKASGGKILPAVVRFAGAMIPRIQDTIMAPLMEYYVPAMKAGTFANLMRDELRVNPNMDRMTLRNTAGRIWNSVDNRLGQFVYDNLFWDKTLKDIGHVGVRSLGWNLGTIRELAGGMASLKDGRKITAGEFHQITDSASYVLALPIATAMMGATWGMLHGTWNQNWGIKDYLFPPTSGKADKRGDIERASMPGYMKDAIEWTTHPLDTALSKRHPLFDLVWQMMNNEQWNGAGIYDPRPGKETTLQKAGDYGKFLAEQFEPIMFKSQLPPGTKIPLWENFFGIKPAPHAVREVLGEKPTAHETQVMREKGAQKVRMDREKR